MRTQEELGRKESVMDAIIRDNKMSLMDNLKELCEMPENYINVIYEVSYDEMKIGERKESKKWIESELIQRIDDLEECDGGYSCGYDYACGYVD